MAGLLSGRKEMLPAWDAILTCVHGRIIDDVLTAKGRKTGKVRCMECGAIFDDPYLKKERQVGDGAGT